MRRCSRTSFITASIYPHNSAIFLFAQFSEMLKSPQLFSSWYKFPIFNLWMNIFTGSKHLAGGILNGFLHILQRAKKRVSVTLFHCSQANVGLFAAFLSRDSKIKTFFPPHIFFIFFHIVCGVLFESGKPFFPPSFFRLGGQRFFPVGH